MGTLRYAWRNIWRNPKRTTITVVAIAINTAVLIMCFALIRGTEKQMVDNATQVVVGLGQAHRKGYLDDRSIYSSLEKPDDLLAAAERSGLAAAPRSYGFGLVAIETKSAGALFWGVDPERERRAFRLPERLVDGSYLDDVATGKVVLGRKLARSLRAEVGSELVCLVQAADGSIGNELYTVSGILATSGDDIDRGAAILHRDDFETLFLAGGRVHEVALNVPVGERSLSAEELRERLSNVGKGAAASTDVRSWWELMPALSDMLKLNEASAWILALIFLLAAGLGVVNTMLMATHDRVREYGMLKALGATPWRILADVAAEGWMLALVSTAIGVALGLAGGFYLETEGIDLSLMADGMTFAGVAFDPVWRAAVDWNDVIEACLMMWLMCVAASLYPAVKAARLNALSAIHHT